MSKRNIIALATLLIVGAGSFYAISSGYVRFGAPAQLDNSVSQSAEKVDVSSASQAQEIKELREQVEQLNAALQKPKEDAPSAPPIPASMMSVSSPVSSLESTVPPAAPASQAAATTNPAPPAAPAKVENAGTVFEGCTVTVTDTKTPAEMALGRDWPITKLYFLDANGDSLGSISGTAYNEIMDKYKIVNPVGGAWDAPGANGEWEFWFAEEFNSYRGMDGSTFAGLNETEESANSGFNSSAKDNVDIDEYALEVIALTNKEREDAGLHILETDSSLMTLAQTRAEELAIQYSHTRPDGTRVVDLGYGENGGAKGSPSAQVNSWMESDGHRTNILRDKYNYIGVGCYQSDNGKLYWVQIFSR